MDYQPKGESNTFSTLIRIKETAVSVHSIIDPGSILTVYVKGVTIYSGYHLSVAKQCAIQGPNQQIPVHNIHGEVQRWHWWLLVEKMGRRREWQTIQQVKSIFIIYTYSH